MLKECNIDPDLIQAKTIADNLEKNMQLQLFDPLISQVDSYSRTFNSTTKAIDIDSRKNASARKKEDSSSLPLLELEKLGKFLKIAYDKLDNYHKSLGYKIARFFGFGKASVDEKNSLYERMEYISREINKINAEKKDKLIYGDLEQELNQEIESLQKDEEYTSTPHP